MGGFPGPIELLQRLVHTKALGFISRMRNRTVTYWRSRGQRGHLSWLPDSIDGLIVGRNSEFYTDELTDEQLEHLGGIEYRALRYLSYFVFIVSVETSRYWPLLTIYKPQVFRGIQPHTLHDHCPLVADEVHVRRRLCGPAQTCSQGVVYRLVSENSPRPVTPLNL
jgi:hypothetical protein